jgi:hypothetical protein
MVQYLRLLKSRIARVAPSRPVVLVMDDSSIHIGDDVLAECRRLRFAVVIVPSRMTWALQPLDTHVFARLKAEIRSLTFEASANSPSGRLPPNARVRLHGAAIRRVLVQSSWSTLMARAGFAGPGHALNTKLQELLGAADLEPQFPSADALREILNVTAGRAPRLLEALRATLDRATPQADSAAAAVADFPAEAGSVGEREGRVIPIPRLRLANSARLPPASAQSAQPMNFLFVAPPRDPIMTRSRTAAEPFGGGASASAAAVPLWRRRRCQ